jgi:hypothetical protein
MCRHQEVAVSLLNYQALTHQTAVLLLLLLRQYLSISLLSIK